MVLYGYRQKPMIFIKILQRIVETRFNTSNYKLDYCLKEIIKK